MIGKITAVINTFNEEKTIERVINSLKWVDEIVVCDMHSDDNTPVIAKKMGAVVMFHKRVGYVEPARNFAVSKASHEWILVVDADEEIPESLADYIKDFVNKHTVSNYLEIPRKNIIFGSWMKASMWWPDYQIRFFRKGTLVWGSKIHSKPNVEGQGVKIPPEERWAIIHHHYNSISQYLQRMIRYTDIQAKELKKDGYKFEWRDLINKPLAEFLSRFFANKGFEDGLHGFSLSLLQAISFFVLYLKLWEYEKFEEKQIPLKDLDEERKNVQTQIDYWFKYGNLPKNLLKRLVQKAKNKIS